MRQAFVNKTALLASIGLAACGRGDSDASTEWSGSVRDSAGIVVVSNHEGGYWTDQTGWLAEADLIIGAESAPEYQFGWIADLDVGPNGIIHVLDNQSAKVSVYDTAGRFVRSFGRAGKGPGEFSIDAFAIRVDEQGNVLIRDGINSRDNVFDSVGGFLRSVTFEGPLKEWDILPQGGFVSRSTASEWDGLVRLATSRVIVDTITSFNYDIAKTRGALSTGPSRGTTAPIPIPLLPPVPAWTLTSDGRIAAGISNHYRINVFRADGSLEMIIEKRHPQRQLSSDDHQRATNRIKELMRESGMSEHAIVRVFERFNYVIPDSLPAFARILGGPYGTIWVQGLLPIDSMGANATLDALIPDGPVWDVFCSAGRYLGAVTLPPGFTLKAMQGDYLYGLAIDELDVQRVIRLKLHSPGRDTVAVPVC